MARINEWWPAFLDGHQRRFPGIRWPQGAEGVEFYVAWRKLFVMRGVTDLAIATEASERLLASPPYDVAGHPAALCELATAVHRERSAAASGLDPSTREGAEASSRDCPICQGVGLVVRYRRRSLRPDRPPSIVLYCTCLYGKWIRRAHAQDAPDVRRRIYDLADYPWLENDYQQPLSPQEYLGEDVPEALREAF
jgi:hypothetical protein